MPPAEPHIETERTVLRLGRDEDAAALLAFFMRNREYHKPWEPRAGEDFYTLATQRALLARRRADYADGRSACLLGFDRGSPNGDVIARINFSEIVRGPFQACYLGYAVDRAYEGKGYMTEALLVATRWAFKELRLHRIMANYQPRNERSGRLLERLGFVREGLAHQYLFIDGEWKDHVLTSLTVEAATEGGA